MVTGGDQRIAEREPRRSERKPACGNVQRQQDHGAAHLPANWRRDWAGDGPAGGQVAAVHPPRAITVNPGSQSEPRFQSPFFGTIRPQMAVDL